MRTSFWFLITVLAIPAGAAPPAEKPQTPPAAPAAAPAAPAEDPLAVADQKAAAGDIDGAIALLKKAAGGSPPAALHLGRMYERKSELDFAIETYSAVAGKLTGGPRGEALGRLSVLQELRGMKEWKATADAALAADAEGAWPTLAVSRVRARDGKRDEALALAQKAVAAGGGAAAQAALGRAQEAARDVKAAETAYQEAIAKESRPEAVLGLARVLRQTGRVDEADAMVQKLLQAVPGAVEAYKESARIRIAQNRPMDALGDVSTADVLAEGDPEIPPLKLEVEVAKALALVASNQMELAVQDLTTLKDQNPNSPEIRFGLAKALLARRQTDAALAEFQKAVSLDPDLAEAYFQIGYIQHQLKRNPTAALPAYEKAVSFAPGRTDYRTNLGACLSDLREFDRAIAELSKVTENPTYRKADAWTYLGAIYINLKKYKEAADTLLRADALLTDNVTINANLAWAYFGLKDRDNFIKYGRKARALGHKEVLLLERLTLVESGQTIK
jgi:tetratricopeptide (TPR) repeat protein